MEFSETSSLYLQFWSPHLRKDIQVGAMERVLLRDTFITGLAGLKFKEWLKEAGLWPLKRRQLQRDLMEMIKIIKGIDKISAE